MPRAAEIMVVGGEETVVAKRESWEEMVERER